jgi:hypothetical protein
MEIQFTPEQETRLHQIASQMGRPAHQVVLDFVLEQLDEGWNTNSCEEPGRLLSDCLSLAKAHGSTVTLDEQFSDDLQEIISQREPLNTSAWD